MTSGIKLVDIYQFQPAAIKKSTLEPEMRTLQFGGNNCFCFGDKIIFHLQREDRLV